MKVWSFLWRFAVAVVPLALAFEWIAGYGVGLAGGGHVDARSAGFVALGVATLVAAILALGTHDSK